ncbi:1,4-alpha-glucan branching enzyme [Pseudoclavibacter sp. RFBI5]|uniref:1,4-alpha-glucan branching protein GlgB n=1 Tax=Pseudoclavibacter sp. RFBI5 TaxID=2080578 RepID=UPI000CE77B83|nr:1,4-alpha-glucan branching protein GlgB [Pseudoclavibacter sp. RFBI5]PPG04257.1 1,4-alpha-glucan branching enzyme [Pseudoclavibacter sp. RFBI5]
MTDELKPAAPAPIGAPEGELRSVAEGTHSGPHAILGQHLQEDGRTLIRARRPLAERVSAILESSGERVELQHLAHGIWQGVHEHGLDDYRIETVYSDGVPHIVDDPYRFLPVVGEVDQFLFGEGRHERLWHVFGAHHREHWGTHSAVWGTSFVVWAPHAQAVRVIGSFNGWDGRAHALRRLDALGIWELFVPGVTPHETYKFQIRTASGDWVEKADPLALHAEQPPQTASVIANPSTYEWGDGDWMTSRAQKDPHTGPMTTYELHAMSWRPGLGYRELADQLVEYLDGLEFTHVEFMPLSEHPFGGSWGYQVTGYYAPTSRLGSPDDLRYLIDRLHQAGYGVIMDWVPGHFPKDSFGLAEFDGQALYEHADPRLGEQLDWGTKVFNFGDSQVRNFLVANALYWLEEFHIDGLRVDAVASILYLDYSREEWVPNIHGGRENLEAIAFLQEVNATAYKLYPGIAMIAEESTSWAGVTKPTEWGGLGFGLKWNMGWMNDSLRYVERDPIYRSHHQGDLTFSFVYAWSERFLLPISHDEVVHGKGSLYSKMPGDEWQKLAGTRLFLAYQWGHPGKQLLFMGQEFAQQTEWSESRGLDWWELDNPGHAGVQRLVGDLNRLAKHEGALWELDDDSSGMVWLSGDDAANSVLAFARRGFDGTPDVAMIFNFSNQAIGGYRLGLPHAGRWSEVLNTDAETYAGSGAGNYGSVTTEDVASHGFAQSAAITLPPLAAVWLKFEG